MKKLSLPLMATALLFSAAGAQAEDWPQWRGPDRNDVSQEKGLLKSWSEKGPTLLWSSDQAGLGYAGIAVVGDRVYTLGARDQTEYLIALDTATGKEVWATQVGQRLANGWGDGPRSTPTVDKAAGLVFAISGHGNLAAVQAQDGKVVWQVSMTKDMGGRTPNWGFTESPLVEGDRVYCTPGGANGAIAALDAKTGQVIWRSKEFTDDAQYSSLVSAEIGGKRQVVQLTMKSVAGVAVEDGKLLWRSDWPGRTAVVPTPIVRGNDVLVTSGYGVGAKLVRVGPDQATSDAYFQKDLANHHGGVLLVGDHVYGHSDAAGWVCMEFATGNVLWRHKDRGAGKGGLTCADGMLWCLTEDGGTLILADASPAAWKELARFTIPQTSPNRSPKGRVWTHPVIANGRLYLRDQELLFCFDVKM